MPDSPFSCRSTLNCYAASQTFDVQPGALFEEVAEAVRSLSGLTIGSATHVESDNDGLGLRAPFRVFLFTDDLELCVEPHARGSVLHVRSASRVRRSDLGTNRRRVDALFECLDENQR